MTEYELSSADMDHLDQVIKTSIKDLYARINECMDALEKLTDPLADEIVTLKRRVRFLEEAKWEEVKTK